MMNDSFGAAGLALTLKPEEPMTHVIDPPTRIDQDLVAQLVGKARADWDQHRRRRRSAGPNDEACCGVRVGGRDDRPFGL